MEGKIALITGGASGIGAACVELLARRGARPVILDLDKALADRTAAELGCPAYQADITVAADVDALADRIEREVGHVEMLVNCAGMVQLDAAPPEEIDYDAWDRIMAVNVRGTFTCCRVFGSRMARRGSGSIVNIASIGGMRSMPLHAYSPSKAAVINLTECLAGEWGRSGVRVNTVTPGYTLTALAQGAIDSGQRDLSRLVSTTATGRLALPEDLANAIIFLLSDQAQSITGVNLPVDNGYLVALSWQQFGGCREPVPVAETAQAG